MASDKMSIAFLAPDQSQRQEPGPNASTLFPQRLNSQDLNRSYVDSHQSIPTPSAFRVPDQTSNSLSRTASEEDQGQLRSQDSLSPSPTTGEGPSNAFRRQPRSPRPTYSEEQRFFVMFARIIQDKAWPDIEEDFARIFKQRSKGGLCSLYYRVRRNWGFEDVLKSGSQYWALEKKAVDDRASRFSREFLISIGYLRA